LIGACVAAAFAWVLVGAFHLFLVSVLMGQEMDDSIVSKHVRVRIAAERQLIGREAISDLERCWEFVDSATGGQLPRRVQIVIGFQDAAMSVDAARATLSIGMSNPAASRDPRGFLLQNAAREMARLALINLSSGGAAKDENRFLLQGMAEMLAHDFSNTVKRLGAAWAICFYLDRMNPLTLKRLAVQTEATGGNHDLLSASPGITFLTACREQYGRERLFKLFESMSRRSLDESLGMVFKGTTAGLEAQWLARIRNYHPADLTSTTEGEVPALDRITFVPESGRPGENLSMRLYAHDGADDLSPGGIFVVDESSGKVLQGAAGGKGGDRYIQFEIPIDPGRPPGRYRLQVAAVDDEGNIRNWEASYLIAR
jgi:hypothetical protein